jgi:hypothetical protein
MRAGRGQPPRSLRLPLRPSISSGLRVRLRSLALATTRPLGKRIVAARAARAAVSPSVNTAPFLRFLNANCAEKSFRKPP